MVGGGAKKEERIEVSLLCGGVGVFQAGLRGLETHHTHALALPQGTWRAHFIITQ